MRPIRYGDKRQFLTSAADTTHILTSPMRRYFSIIGTGVQFWVQLPDARTIAAGTPMEFENASSEIVGIKNSSLSVWRRVPPRWSLVCVLRDGSTAAGVWDTYWRPAPPAEAGLFQVTDFTNAFSTNAYNAEAGWAATVSGGTNALDAVGDPAGTCGILKQTVAAAGQWAGIFNVRYQAFAGGPKSLKYRASRSAANAAANEFTTRIGFGNTAGGAIADGAYFINDFTAYGNFWTTVTISTALGGSTVNTTADVPVVYPTFESLLIEVDTGAARVDFFVGKNLRFTHTTNIPLIPILAISNTTKVADASNRLFYLDYVQFGFYPTAER